MPRLAKFSAPVSLALWLAFGCSPRGTEPHDAGTKTEPDAGHSHANHDAATTPDAGHHATSDAAPADDAGPATSDAGMLDLGPDAAIETLPARPGSDFAAWGAETLDMIERDFRKAGTDLYLESMGKDAVSFNWGAGTQLHALIAAGRIEQAEKYVTAMSDAYWCNTNSRWAYNATPFACGDRYYDDNAWVAKALMELYEKTQKADYLNRAKDTVAFSMSGENATNVQPYGGIRWHEGDADGQCLCATAPTLVSNLMIYRATQTQQYLTDGKRLYEWVKANRFGYGPGYRGYENAVVMQGALLLFQITGDYAYLDDAHHLAYAMESNYVDWESHALRETGQWGGHDMTNAYVDLFNVDGDVNWLNIPTGYLSFLHENSKDAAGHYPETWTETGVPGKTDLLYNAAAARAFAKLGNTRGGNTKARDPVAVFQDCNYQGVWRAGLPIGKYKTSDLEFRGLRAKDLSSLRVHHGYQVTLYKADEFQGESLLKNSDDSCLADDDGWNDSVNSLVVEAIKPLAVLYKDCNFTGNALNLGPGKYDADKLRALGVSPASVSSLQVAEGLEVLLYGADEFADTPHVSGTDSCLVTAGWNDKAVSIEVRIKGK